LEHISKIYPRNKRNEVAAKAIDDISFTVKDKEFMVIVGPSGCGKSTLLRMIAGLEEISEGTLSIDGKRMNDLPPSERDIAMVFQNYALYPHMTVYDNMAFGLRLKHFKKTEIRERVMQTAQLLEMEEVLETLRDLKARDIDIVTIGQYLRPTPQHLPIVRYATPDEFREYARLGEEMGLRHVESGPLVRSSYHAWDQLKATTSAAAQ